MRSQPAHHRQRLAARQATGYLFQIRYSGRRDRVELSEPEVGNQ